MALVWSKCYQQTDDEQYCTAARDSIELIERHQRLDGPEEIAGGVPGSHPLYGKYMYLWYPNWASKFFADALLVTRSLSAEETVPESIVV